MDKLSTVFMPRDLNDCAYVFVYDGCHNDPGYSDLQRFIAIFEGVKLIEVEKKWGYNCDRNGYEGKASNYGWAWQNYMTSGARGTRFGQKYSLPIYMKTKADISKLLVSTHVIFADKNGQRITEVAKLIEE